MNRHTSMLSGTTTKQSSGLVDVLQDLDPTDLEGVFSEAIVPGNPLGGGKEAGEQG